MSFPHRRLMEELLLYFPASGTYHVQAERPSGSLLENVGSARRDLSIFVEFRSSTVPGSGGMLLDLSTLNTYVGVGIFIVGGSGKISMYNISVNPTQRIDIQTGSNLCDGEVHRLVFTRDNTGTANGLVVYIDSSTADATHTHPSSTPLSSDKIPVSDIRIGSLNGAVKLNNAEVGAIGVWDDVIISPEEISKLMGDPRYWIPKIQKDFLAFGSTLDGVRPGKALDGYRGMRDIASRPMSIQPGMSFNRIQTGARNRNNIFTGSKGGPLGLIGTLDPIDELTVGGSVFPSQGMTALGSVGYVSSVSSVGRYSDLTFATETASNTGILSDPSLPVGLNHIGGLTPDVARGEILAIVSEANLTPGAVVILNGTTLAIEDVIDTSALGLSNQDGLMYDPAGPYLYIGSSNLITRYDYNRGTPALSNPVGWWVGGSAAFEGSNIGAIQGILQLDDKSILVSVISTNMQTFPGLVHLKEPESGRPLLRLAWFSTRKSAADHDEGLFLISDDTRVSGYRLYVSDSIGTTTIRVVDPIGL